MTFELRALLAEQARRNPPRTFSDLESLLTQPDLFGLTTATPLQRAICRIADGLPLGDLANNPAVMGALGANWAAGQRPKELVLLSGIRVGKSLLAALLAVYWTQTCDVSRLGPGEIPRISIVSVHKDLAEVVFGHVVGRIMSSERLKKLVIGKPLADSITLKHPTGIPIEICVVAGTRAGASLVARWSAGCIFDEFPRMMGQDEGVINWDDSRRAVLERILPGAQMVSIGSPWAPHGPAYDVFTSSWGKPSPDMVVIKAPAWDLNPFWWTPDRIENARKNPDTFVTEVLGEFRSPEVSLFSTVEIDVCTRACPPNPVELPPDPRCTYRAAMDPATRGNGWTLVVATRQGNRKKVVFCKEWLGSKIHPLSPKAVLTEMADRLRPYGVKSVDSDQYLGDALKDLAHDLGLHIRVVNMTEREKAAKFMSLKTKMAGGEIEIPPDKKLRGDLIQVQKRSTTNGIKIVLPKTSDGRHCDYVPSMLLALSVYLEDVVPTTEESDAARLVRQADAIKKERAEVQRVRAEKMNRMRGMSWRR